MSVVEVQPAPRCATEHSSRRWAALVAFAYGFYFTVFALPVSQRWLSLDVSNPQTIGFGVIVGLIGMAAIEVIWWVTAVIRGETPRLWGQPAKASLE